MKKTLLSLLLITALSGCGLKGELYLTEDVPSNEPAPTAPANTGPSNPS